MALKTKEPSEADIIFNRANVALAKSQRLIASWLPAPTPEELAKAKSPEELAKEEEDMFAPVPELLGVGAAPPRDAADGILRRKDTSSLEALRRQLLGRNATKPLPSKGPTASVGKPLVDRTSKPAVELDSDDEGGRTTAFTSKTARRKGLGKEKKSSQTDGKPSLNGDSDDDEEAALKGNSSKPAVQAPSKRKASSYLDEILAEKSKKKKKRQKKNSGNNQV